MHPIIPLQKKNFSPQLLYTPPHTRPYCSLHFDGLCEASEQNLVAILGRVTGLEGRRLLSLEVTYWPDFWTCECDPSD